MKTLNILLLLSFLGLTISCTQQGKDFATEACMRENLNCASPSTVIDLVGGDNEDEHDSVNADGTGGDVGAVTVKSIRYGENAVIEFLIKNPRFNPLKNFTLTMVPSNPAFEVIAGRSYESCEDNILTYKETCSVTIKYQPDKVPPGIINLTFAFETLTGTPFTFTSSFDPAVLIPDFFIEETDLTLPTAMVYSGAAGATNSGDIVVANTASKVGEDLTIASIGFKDGDSCSLVAPTSDQCIVGSVLTAQSIATCNIKVAFKPTTVGKDSCILEILATNGTYRNYTFSGTAVGLTSTTEQLDFGIVKTSSAAVPKSLTVTVGTDAATTGATSCSVALDPVDAAFGVVTNPVLPATLAAASTMTVDVTYTPAATVKSHRSEVVISCDSRGGELRIPISAATTDKVITSDTSNLDFGDVLVGDSATQTITLTNSSGTDTMTDVLNNLSNSMGAGYSISGGTCTNTLAPSSSCTVQVTFTPTASGVSQNNLSNSSSDGSLSPSIAVSGQGLGLASSQSSVDFGYVKVKTDRPWASIIISNEGSASATGCSVSASSLAGTGFSLDEDSSCVGTETLAAGATCTLVPRFTANSTVGSRSANLTMTCTKGGSLTIPLSAEVAASLQLVVVPPTEVNWTDRLVGITEDVEFTFMNQDSTQLAGFSLTPSGVNNPWTQQGNTCGATLNAASTCKYTARYAPSAVAGAEQTGTTSGTITGAGTGVTSVVASFSAVAKKITANQATLSFGQVATSTEALASTRVYFMNPSSVDTASTCAIEPLANFEVSDSDCGASLAPGAQCSALIKLPNTHAVSANLSEDLKYTCSVGGRASVTLSAEIRKTATLAWSGVAAYGNVDIGAPATTVFTLTHTGAGLDLPATSVLVALTPSVGAYSITANNCPTSLSAGASCTVSVQFNPLVEGAAGAALTATSNIAPETVNLTGTGVDPDKRISSTDTGVSFATALVGSTHTDTITLENTAATGSSGNITVASVSSPWSTAGCHNTSLNVGATCDITVTYAPTSVGSSNTNLGVTSTNAANSFALSGTATKITAASEYNYGDVPLNATRDSSTITISNPSTLDDASGCVLSAEAPFSVQTETCTTALDKNDTCDVVVRLAAPAVPTTYTTKKLTVACTVGGTAEVLLKANVKDMPLATLSGNSQFADWDLDNGPLTRVFTINNTNGGSINLGSPTLTGSSSFSIASTTCGSTLANGASCTVSVSFDPTASGSQTGTFSLAIDDGTKTGTLATNLSGTGTIMDLDVDATTLAFAIMRVGDVATETKTATITNNGNRTANLTYSALAAPWTTGGTCGATLVAGASCTYDITSHAAGAAAVHDTTFVITETQQSDTDTTNVAITGATWDAPLLSLKDDRAQVAYTASDIALTDITGDIDVPATNIVDLSPTSRTVTFTVKNNRFPAFPLSNLAVTLTKNSGPAGTPIVITSNDCTGAELEGNETCTIVLTYTPTAIRETASNYTLKVEADDDGTPVDLEVTEIRGKSYKGVDLVEDFAPTTHSFTLLDAASTEETSAITVTNNGDITATSLSLDFSATPTSFSTSANTCGATLAGGASCSFKVKFTPANVAVAHGHTLSVNSTQDSIANFATFKGASYINYMGDNSSSDADGIEPEIASDATYFYTASKFDDGTFTKLSLKVCAKTGATGNINVASCGIQNLTVGGEPFWAGSLAGYKLNLTATTNKILVATSNQKNDNVTSKGISTVLVCNKSSINATTKLMDFTACSLQNVHTLAGIAPITDLGEFTAMHVYGSKIFFSSQTSTGYIITACSYDDSAAVGSAITGCKYHQNSGLTANQAEYTDIAYNGTNLVMAAHRLNTGLYAVSCTVAGDNTLSCGTYNPIDTGTTTYGGNTMYAGAHPYITMDGSNVIIASQQGSQKSVGLRLAKCTIAANAFTCETNKTVAEANDGTGFGLNPSIKVVQRGANRIAWIQTVTFNNYSSPSSATKLVSLYYCDLTNWASGCTFYYKQSAASACDAPIYAREMDIDTTKNLITIPFTAKTIYRPGVLSIGLLPEL